MSIHQVLMYQVICDSCGKSAHESSDHSVWSGPDRAWADAEEWGFVQLSAQSYCWECWHECVTEEVAPGKSSDCFTCRKQR